ncbi:MAG: chaperone modulator CbpM [Flavobacteriaceae bacterium]
MNKKDYISVDELCNHYHIEISFFTRLNDMGLIKMSTIQKTECINRDVLSDVEKMLRLHQELDVNFEGIDVAFNLLKKIELLQEELQSVKNRLHLFEN